MPVPLLGTRGVAVNKIDIYPCHMVFTLQRKKIINKIHKIHSELLNSKHEKNETKKRMRREIVNEKLK